MDWRTEKGGRRIYITQLLAIDYSNVFSNLLNQVRIKDLMNIKKAFATFAYLQLFIYSLLILGLFYFIDKNIIFETIRNKRILYALQLSITTATIVMIISMLFSIPSAYVLSRFDIPFKTLIDGILELPLIVSPSALGAMILIFFNTPTGEFLKSSGIDVAFTVMGIIVAQFISTVGIATRLVKTIFDEIPKRLEDVAKTLGATPYQAFKTITLPIATKGIISTGILIWAKALGEFGATITVAGSMGMKTETLPIAIFMSLSSANLKETVVLILIILFIGLVSTLIIRKLSKKSLA